MLRRCVSRVSVLVLFVVTFVFFAHAAKFSNASLKGGYSYLINLRTANQSTNQFAMVGVMNFDGAGDVTGSYTSISADTVSSGSLSGHYSIAANGKGEITVTTGTTAEFAVTLNSFLNGIAQGIELLQINDHNNEIMSGTAVQQSATTQAYSAASLKGAFALQYNPWTADGALAEDGGVALFTFDGISQVTTSETTVYDGTTLSGNGSFTYTVSADGTGTILPTGKGPQFAFALNSVASGLGKGFQFLDTNTSDGPGNLVITGSALKQ